MNDNNIFFYSFNYLTNLLILYMNEFLYMSFDENYCILKAILKAIAVLDLALKLALFRISDDI